MLRRKHFPVRAAKPITTLPRSSSISDVEKSPQQTRDTTRNHHTHSFHQVAFFGSAPRNEPTKQQQTWRKRKEPRVDIVQNYDAPYMYIRWSAS